ncbi:MAG: hypothetical protein JSS14_15135 [Proteobacteria bacterium]|nr:hypothetical protein [Pseudomonadota bacterium]
MNLHTLTGLRRTFSPFLRQESTDRLALLRPQMDRLLERLQRVGVKCEVASSFARECAPLSDRSDVEVLILDHAGLRDFRLLEIAWDEVTEAEVHLVFASDVVARQVSCSPPL